MTTRDERLVSAHDRLDSVWRMQNMPDVRATIARSGTGLVGFKVGYAVTATRYHSWLGGVHPGYRQSGIAGVLMRRQHGWIASRGYQMIETEVIQSRHRRSQLNERAGFLAAGVRFDKDQPRIIYRKLLGGSDRAD
jgi:hypothetical protein